MDSFSLADLDRIIQDRASSTAEKSYTKSLLEAGIARAAKKFGEEAIETVISATEGDQIAVRNEAADTLFHLLVLLRACNVSLSDVFGELQRRTAQSGLEEKASRPEKS